MTTVAELIEFLTQFPQDTTVEVMGGHTSRDYYGDTFSRVNLELPLKPLEWIYGNTDTMFEKHVEFYNGYLLLGFEN